MRWVLVIALLVLAPLAVACGDEGDEGTEGDGAGGPELTFEAQVVGESLTLSIETDLPNDAVLTWDAWDEDPEVVEDTAHETGEVTVTSGQATAVVDATSFQEEAYVTVTYTPDAPGQPDAVSEAYGTEVQEDKQVTLEAE